MRVSRLIVGLRKRKRVYRDGELAAQTDRAILFGKITRCFGNHCGVSVMDTQDPNDGDTWCRSIAGIALRSVSRTALLKREHHGSVHRSQLMDRGHVFKQVVLVHEPIAANFARELRQLSALDALVLEKRLLPLVRFPATLAEESSVG